MYWVAFLLGSGLLLIASLVPKGRGKGDSLILPTLLFGAIVMGTMLLASSMIMVVPRTLELLINSL